MKVIKLEDIKIKEFELYHTNTDNHNSKIYKSEGIFTTVFCNPKDIYNMFIKHESFINYLCPGLVSLIEENGKLKGYQMKMGTVINNNECIKYLNENRNKIIEFAEKSGFFYCDWKGDNMISIDNKLTLIDFDSFIKIMKEDNIHYGLQIDWYIDKVNELSRIIDF